MTRTTKEVADDYRKARVAGGIIPNRPEASDEELAAASGDARKLLGLKKPVAVAWADGSVGPKHNDSRAFTVRLDAALGTRSPDWVATQISALDAATRERRTACGADPEMPGLNAGLALVSAIGPKDELESALAVQMAGTHALTVEMLGKARHADTVEGLQAYVDLAVKLERTFTSQLEALSKMRGGGKQVVEHRYVYVQGNAVVGDVHEHHSGAGGGAGASQQPLPHAPSPVWRLRLACRCGAKTRQGTPCQSPAIRGKKRCRMHGGRSTGPGWGSANPNWKGGAHTREAKGLRRDLAAYRSLARRLADF